MAQMAANYWNSWQDTFRDLESWGFYSRGGGGNAHMTKEEIAEERKLLRRAQQGDPEALAEYVERYGEKAEKWERWVDYDDGQGGEVISVFQGYFWKAVSNAQQGGQTWYFMSRENGQPHGLAYDPYNGIIYEVNHPCHANGLRNWLKGLSQRFSISTVYGAEPDDTKSVAYQWDMTTQKGRDEFWAREKGSTFLLAPVTVMDPSQATAWFQSQQGVEWDYNFFTDNCGDYACKEMNAGGAGLDASGWSRPSQFPGKFTMSWSEGQNPIPNC